MDRDLRSKNISEDMFAHFQEICSNTVKNVSIVLERVACCATDCTDKDEQARNRQLYLKHSRDYAARILTAKVSKAEMRRAKRLAARTHAASSRAVKDLTVPPSHPGPHSGDVSPG